MSGGAPQPVEMVLFLDAGQKPPRVVRIPATELAPGAIKLRLQDTGEMVWALPSQLKEGPHQSAALDPRLLPHIEKIQRTFAEHYRITLEQWIDGFRRDRAPEREVAIWAYSADVYLEFTEGEYDPARRKDVYDTITACFNTNPRDVWKVLRPKVLSAEEAERIVRRFFGEDYLPREG